MAWRCPAGQAADKVLDGNLLIPVTSTGMKDGGIKPRRCQQSDAAARSVAG